MDSHFFAVTEAIVGVRPSNSKESREVAKLFAPPWKVVNDLLRAKYLGNAQYAPAVDMKNRSLNIIDGKKTGAVLRAFGAYLLGCSDRYQLVASENSAGIACEVVEQLATGAIQAAAAGPQDEAT